MLWPEEILDIGRMLMMRDESVWPEVFNRLVLEEKNRLRLAGHNLKTKQGMKVWANAVKKRVTDEYLDGDWIDEYHMNKTHYFRTGEVVRKKPELRRVK